MGKKSVNNTLIRAGIAFFAAWVLMVAVAAGNVDTGTTGDGTKPFFDVLETVKTTAEKIGDTADEVNDAAGSANDAAVAAKVAVSVQSGIDAARTGSFIAAAAACVALLIQLLKLPALGGLIKKLPQRFRPLVPLALGAIAGILDAVIAGAPWSAAIAEALLTGPTALFAHETVQKVIMGEERFKLDEFGDPVV